jgi:hypothetical protein
MRALYGKGTPKQAAEVRNAIVLVLRTDTALTFALIAVIDGEPCGARYRHRHKHELKTRLRQRAVKQPDKLENAHGRLLALISRLQGTAGAQPAGSHPKPAFDRIKISQLRSDLVALSQLVPHPRGFAFEKFLKELFDAHGLEAREPFRLRGEQIDGSFQLSNDTYLVEAKWQGSLTGAADLHGFQGKIEQKAAWTRGLFISNSSFTEDGLIAFGRGKRVICMDGYDLYECLNREIPINHVLERKARRAAETGFPFARVRDLFPG